MSFFKQNSPLPQQPSTTHGGIPRQTQRGDRTMLVRGPEPVPDHRVLAETLDCRGTVGLTNNRVLERLPRGCLFKVAGGYFDLDGYWCVPKADYHTEVRRGASRKINRLLTEAQRWELQRVRLNARRRGVR